MKKVILFKTILFLMINLLFISISAQVVIEGSIQIRSSPEEPEAGEVKWNNDTNDIEGFDGTNWRSFTKLENAGTFGASKLLEIEGITSPNGSVEDLFWNSVAVDGDFGIIGAFKKNIDRGAIYFVKKENGEWIEDGSFSAPNSTDPDRFGFSVAISGNYAIVGAYQSKVGNNSNQGKAFIYERDRGSWSLIQEIVAPDGNSNSRFGWSVAIDGDYAIVGAVLHSENSNSFQGKAYIFKRSGTNWIFFEELIPNNATGGQKFGWSVDISTDFGFPIAFVGAPETSVNSVMNAGKVYIYSELVPGNWLFEVERNLSNPGVNDRFGHAVTIDGTRGFVSAPFRNNIGVVREIDTDNWQFTNHVFKSPDLQLDQQFGYHLSCNNGFLVVGSNFYDQISSSTLLQHGKAYLFEYVENQYFLKHHITHSDGGTGDEFGRAVATDGVTIMIGAQRHDVLGNSDQGKVYVY